METVDYRYDDPPTRPYIPWRAGLASFEMQRLSVYHHWPHLSLVKKGGVSTFCFGLYVVRVASPRAPGAVSIRYLPWATYFTSFSPRTVCLFWFCSFWGRSSYSTNTLRPRALLI